MGAGEIGPFWPDNGGAWNLNERNPYVRAYLNSDAEDAAELESDENGKVGELTGAAADYYPLWVIIEKTGASMQEIESCWTLDRIGAFMAYLSMTRDYKGVWGEYFQAKAKRENSESKG